MGLLKNLIIRRLRKQGYSEYFAPRVLDERFNDLFSNKETTWKQKIWAQKRGFLSDKIAFYGLTEENFKDYLSDFDYYKLHPINGPYSHWIDDKLTMKLILHPFSEYLPEYYYQISNGQILKLMDCPEGYESTIEDIIRLLYEKHFLAAKLYSGTFANGFLKISYEGENILINNVVISYESLVNLISSWLRIRSGGYLITEYLSGNSELGKIWNQTPNTLRTMVINEDKQQAKLASSFFRFGSSKTGVVDNASIGGVCCHVNNDTGEFSDGRILKDHELISCPNHPDTNMQIGGILPSWESFKTILIKISAYLPQLKYMGYDVIFTNNGFKIIEINSHQGIKFHQFYQPFFANEITKDFFGELIQQKKFLRESKKKNSLSHKSARFVKRWVEKPIKIIANKLGKINPNG